MLASKQLFWDSLAVPSAFDTQPTSRLLSNGCFCYFDDPSAPFYMPIGQIVLENLTRFVNRAARRHGVWPVTVPLMIRDDILEIGQKLEGGFADRIIKLADPLSAYHLLFTPEPVLLSLARLNLLSYRQLPYRIVYHADLFRQVTDPKGLLRNRQFKIFMGTAFDDSTESVIESLHTFEQLTQEILDALGVPTRRCVRSAGITSEFYYFCAEGDQLFIPEINPDERVRCLSVAMAYQYGADQKLPARFQNRQNSKERVQMTTYGMGIQRLFYVVFDACRDRLGFRLPKGIRPFEVSVIPKAGADLDRALSVQRMFDQHDISCLLDDRLQISPGQRAAFSDYTGAPVKVFVEDETYRVRRRAQQDELRLPIADTPTEQLRALLEQ